MPEPDLPAADAALAAGVRAGQRRALAKAITLIESTRADHQARARALTEHLLPASGRSLRLGISGVPGVGKSTFIEALGMHLIGLGHRVAVLAVDPSSSVHGGSILGDKTRMEQLSMRTEAFIRPSPAGATLGGVARRTREAGPLCEAAGFDVILIETVGVGQSETAVADMVDLFMLLLLPGGGDELQGIKKGIVELADLVVVNKADGDLVTAAHLAVAEYQHALALLRPATGDWKTPVLSCSAIGGSGLDDIWAAISRYRDSQGASGALANRRADQAAAWLWNEIRETLVETFRNDLAVKNLLPTLETRVRQGQLPATAAAVALLDRFQNRGDGT